MSQNAPAFTNLELPALGDLGDERLQRVIERPDGYHWIDVNGHQEFGPFETLAQALADMDSADEPAFDEPDCIEWPANSLPLSMERGDPAGDGFEDAAWALVDAV
jgi:hypothetical protein